MKFECLGQLHKTMTLNYKYFVQFNGICRVLQIGFLIGLNVASLMTALSFSCKTFVYIASGLAFLGASFWLTSNVLRPERHNFTSTRWQEGFHDALSALMLLVVATVLLFQELNVPIGLAVFFSLSCALCFTVQGFGNLSAGRQSRMDKYLGKYQLSPQQDEVCLTDVGPQKPHRTFTITSADDDDDDDVLPLPTITVHNVDEEKEAVAEQSAVPKENLSTLITGVGGTPEVGDRSGMSELFYTPQETPSGHGNVGAAAEGTGAKPTVTPWDPTAFATPTDQTQNIPVVPEEAPLIDVGAFVGSPDITFNIKPMTNL